jgi:hypothetical protein
MSPPMAAGKPRIFNEVEEGFWCPTMFNLLDDKGRPPCRTRPRHPWYQQENGGMRRFSVPFELAEVSV